MATINKEFVLGRNEGDNRKAKNNIIIAHETGNANNVGKGAGRNEASYMKTHFESAYTHFIVENDGSVIYQIGEPAYVAWGAGPSANVNSPIQVELARTNDKAVFAKGYKVYIDLLREQAKKYGIPVTLDDGSGRGIKTHNWTSKHWGETDHTDPVGYLSSMGISQAQFKHDIEHGVGRTEPSKPTTPPSKPSKPSSNVPAGFTPENGTFVNGDTQIMNRIGSASTKATQGGYLPPYGTWAYDSYAKIGNFTWIHHVYNGKHVYLPVREWHGNSSTPYGTFK